MNIKFLGSNSNCLIDIALKSSGDFLTSPEDISNSLLGGVRLDGSYAFAICLEEGNIFLARDRIGARKLFYYRDTNTSTVFVSNNFIDLAREFQTKHIYSVPRGGHLIIEEQGVSYHKIHPLKGTAVFDISYVAETLQNFFRFLEKDIKKKPIVCLSGGLDSALIAYLATQAFGNVDVVTAVLNNKRSIEESDMEYHDFFHAKKIAASLKAGFNPVYIDAKRIKHDLSNILKVSQDWRDYNVHCATLNYYLAEYISKNFDPSQYVVLTGDFMNEVFADYTSEVFEGNEYYKQPSFPQKTRQRFFLNGLDSSDREIGVFSYFGLSCVQPYAFISDYYRLLTNDQLSNNRAKYQINGPLLPKALLNLVGINKVRAQVGDGSGGILGYFIKNDITESELKEIFCSEFGFDAEFITSFIHVGAYRTECAE